MFGLLAALLGIFNKPKMPPTPVTPQADDALQSESDRRNRRRRMAEDGRASTFLSGGVSDLGTVQRASDTLRPLGRS